jgi:iron complex transport system ATP-binding protein
MLDGGSMLRAENLTCGYEKKTVLSNVSFQVNKGEFLGIIGPNGSGKTTLLRALSRVIEPSGGMVTLYGRDIRRMDPRLLAKNISVVSQSVSLDGFTVEEFVSLGRMPYYGAFQFFETRKDYEAVQRAMELTGVSGLKDRLLGKMSGGEKQLVLIARALAQEPELILLDEPTAHLDIAHQVNILDLIRRLNREFGLTVVMVLHDLNLAGEYCHRLVLINKGLIHKTGQPGEILNYRDIEEVYGTRVVVAKNPVSRKPYVVLVPGECGGQGDEKGGEN